ncbi:MAG: ribosome-associated translation inhibitor RaiA [Opitutae bacterium]|nr:ribosome-associated translation inhibitor RaiA [Opitutae bacterium]
MNAPVSITYRNLRPSEAVTARVRNEVAKLEHYYERIISCHVLIEVPHRHHHWGDHYHIRVELGVPGNDIVVRHEPSDRGRQADIGTGRLTKSQETAAAHKDIYVLIRDVFDIVRRRLEDHARRQRGDVKRHSQARVPLPV